MAGKRRTPIPRSPTRKRKYGPKPAAPRAKGEAERLAVRRRDAVKYRLAGASYRAIAEKLTEDRAEAYAVEHGVSFERTRATKTSDSRTTLKQFQRWHQVRPSPLPFLGTAKIR